MESSKQDCSTKIRILLSVEEVVPAINDWSVGVKFLAIFSVAAADVIMLVVYSVNATSILSNENLSHIKLTLATNSCIHGT